MKGFLVLNLERARQKGVSLIEHAAQRGVVGPNVNEIVDEMKSFVKRASLNGAREQDVSEVAH